MSEAIKSSSFFSSVYPIYAAVAFFITAFLLFIDEGYYDFRSFKDPGNLLVMSIYFVGIYITMSAFSMLLSRYISGKKHILVSSILGLVFGIALMIGLFTAIR